VVEQLQIFIENALLSLNSHDYNKTEEKIL